MDEGGFVRGIPEQTHHVGEQDQLFRPQGHRQTGGGGVGVDVIGLGAVGPLGHGGHNGDVAGIEAVHHQPGIYLGEVTHQAVFFRQGGGAEQAAVQTAQADGPAAHAVEGGDKIFVHLAAQNLLHHVHGLLVGIAKAVHEPGLLAQLFQGGGDLRPAPVDHHHPDAHQREEDDVAHHGGTELVGDHGVAAVFDYNGLAVEALDVRKGLGQHLGPFHMAVHGLTPPLGGFRGAMGQLR